MSAPTLSRKPVRGPHSPAANRAARPTWRDPRLAVGVGLVALCSLVGVRIVGGADDTVAVWSLRSDLVAGQSVAPGDLKSTRVHFASSADADRYVSAADDLARDAVVTRDLGAGELLPRAALGAAADSDLIEFPISVPAQNVPATLRAGDTVDVWTTPKEGDLENGGRAYAALTGLRVLALPTAGSSLSPSLDRQLILGLGKADQRLLPDALKALATGSVVVTVRTAP